MWFFTLFLLVFLPHGYASATEAVEKLREREQAVRRCVQLGLPATVAIEGSDGAGTGVVVAESGLLLSASHVVGNPGDSLQVVFSDGSRGQAKSLGSYRGVDAGMAKLEGAGPWQYLELASTEVMEPGDWCVALGHSGGYDPDRPAPVRIGRLLERSSEDRRWLRTDCALVGGDSGGPLLNLQGQLIGIHSSIGSSLAENRHVPSDSFVRNWDSMKRGEVRGWLFVGGDLDGPFVGVALVQQADNEVLIGSVLPRSPAKASGLRSGDQILQVNDTRITTVRGLQRRIADAEVGETIEVVVLRDDKRLTKDVIVGSRGG